VKTQGAGRQETGEETAQGLEQFPLEGAPLPFELQRVAGGLAGPEIEVAAQRGHLLLQPRDFGILVGVGCGAGGQPWGLHRLPVCIKLFRHPRCASFFRLRPC
jgi:hypothetical protein